MSSIVVGADCGGPEAVATHGEVTGSPPSRQNTKSTTANARGCADDDKVTGSPPPRQALRSTTANARDCGDDACSEHAGGFPGCQLLRIESQPVTVDKLVVLAQPRCRRADAVLRAVEPDRQSH